MAPQGVTFSWGTKTCERFYQAFVWQLQNHLLQVDGCSMKSETEETKERVKVRSAATTEVASGSKELGDQIARLMAALTRAEQGRHPASAPNSPRHRGCGRG